MRRHKISKSIRAAILAWSMVVACLMLFGVSFAWFTKVERVTESKVTNVMEPYHLSLLNPGETSAMQLSIGNLIPGNTKQILFCVSNKNNENSINMGGGDFDYSLELIHTDNLALIYTLYALEQADEETADLVSEDTVTENGETTTTYSYWIRGQEPLEGIDVSTQRHEHGSVNLTGTEVNCGTYTSYTNENNNNQFHLTDSEDGYASEYFLLEIDWQEIDDFAEYEKETDMIYLLVKALLPEPEKKE